MSKKIVLLALGAVVVICLGAAAALVVLLFRVGGGGPLPFLRTQSLQSQALANACPPHGTVVPGSFQADPVQNVGEWSVETFVAVCDVPGQPRQAMSGFYAIDHQGTGCGGNGSVPPTSPAAAGDPLTLAVVMSGGCGGSSAPGSGAPGSLSVISGSLSGPGGVTARADFAGGSAASAPIRGAQFVIAAPGDKPLCRVRALDANGAVLAETQVAATGQAGCP